jgi:endoglucanase
MRIVLLAILAALLAAADSYEDGRRSAGLREARLLPDGRIAAVFGAGTSRVNLAKHPGWIQVVGPGDPACQRGVPAAAVEVGEAEPDAVAPEGWAGPRFARFTATISLPVGVALQPGQAYFLRVNGPPALAMNLAAQWIAGTASPAGEDRAPRYGLRTVAAVTPSLLQLELGPGLDLARLAASEVAITSADDPAYAAATAPRRLGRRSTLDFYLPEGWPWRRHDRHLVFAELATPLRPGCSYRIALGERVVLGERSAGLRLDDRTAICPLLKANQVGWLPEAAKFAYLGLWLGDLGACDITALGAFEVRDAASHAVVLSGATEPRRSATFRLRDGKREAVDPARSAGPETVYKQDLSYEDVLQIDLSALRTPGIYYLALPGLGRSHDFRLAADVYREPFRTVMNGLFHQRCGIELPLPAFRAACHRNCTELSTATIATVKSIRDLAGFATDGTKHDLPGGHHDAGDWDPRTHPDLVRILLLAFELNTRAFADGQLAIPERANGIPDLLDEVRWDLDLWCRLQEADGGVREHIETAGDPQDGDAAETDSLREFAYAPTAAGSYAFAAMAAQAALAWGTIGRAQDALAFRERAARAWAWAEAHDGAKLADRRAEAAAALLRASGEAAYDQAFRAASVLARQPEAELAVWSKHDQTFASFHYLRAQAGDPALQAVLRAAFERTFAAWRAAAETTTYRYMRSPHAPNTWGTGGLPVWSVLPAMAMTVAGDPAVRDSARHWLLLSNDFSLGCHPLGLVFTVGLGQRHVSSAWHHLMRTVPGGLIPGLMTNGPGGRFAAGDKPGKSMGNWPAASLWPPGPWPDLYVYAEDASPGMNEGIVDNQAKVALAYALFLPAEP